MQALRVPTIDDEVSYLRKQIAVVRTLLDTADFVLPHGGVSLHQQLAEELSRLGCQLLDVAASLNPRDRSGPSVSGIHRVLAAE